MLSRWFKRSNRLEHPDRETRLDALNTLSPEQAVDAQEILTRLATSDPDAAVRLAAIARISSASALSPVLDDSEFGPAAAQRIVELIKQGEPGQAHDHARVVQARIDVAQAEDLEDLWKLLSTAEQCAALALRLRDTARERLLEQHPLLQTEDGLTVLQRLARGKDKNCHRHAKERLEGIKSARALRDEKHGRLAELDGAIHKALSREPSDSTGLYTHRQTLNKLNDMRTAALTELRTAVDTLTQLGGADPDLSAPQDPLADVDLSLPDPAQNPFNKLQAQLSDVADQMRAGVDIEAIAARRDQLIGQWLEHADHFPPTAEQHDLFEQVAEQYRHYQAAWQRSQALTPDNLDAPAPLPEQVPADADIGALVSARKQWLKRWQKTIKGVRWPAGHEPPAQIAAAEAILQRIDEELKRLNQARDAAVEQLQQAVQVAGEALADGQLEAAKQHLRLARGLQKAGVNQFDKELAALSAQVAEFSDWQKFATDPKRQGLLDALQKLCDAPLEPPEQANELKALRESWRELGRPASAHDIALQKTFDQLADQAFAPCRAYFAEQADQRAANLANREALCDQLESYLNGTDWEHADMQAAETILRSARDEWHKCHPCERRALKPVQKRFEQLQDALHGKVKSAWNANVEAKKAIIERAKVLLQDEGADKVAGAKTLQQAWQEVGRTPRGPDQRLWKEFRQVCDAIFAERDAAQDAARAAVDEQYAALEAAVAALESAAGGSETPSRKAFDQLTGTIETAADGLRLKPAIRQRVDSARDQYQQLLAAEARKGIVAELQQWQQWDTEVSSAEQSGATMEPPHAVFVDRVNSRATPLDWLQLTLEAEIAADLTSPAEDQAARMALQVELMNAGRRNLAEEDYRLLQRRWCEAGPKDAAADALRERFFAALRARI